MRRCLILACVFALGAALEVNAQDASVDALIGRTLTTVTVLADGRPVSSADVLALVETRPQATLSMMQVRESVFHLASIGRFDDVQVVGREDGGGVALTYRLAIARRITSVTFRGASGVDTKRLRDTLGARYLGLLTSQRLRDLEQSLVRACEEQGYFNPRVTTAVEDVPDPARSRLVVNIEAGPRFRIGTINVVEGTGVSRAEVLARLAIKSGDPWDATRLGERRDRLEAYLRAQGYYEAAVNWEAVPRDAEPILDVDVDAEPGPMVRLVFDSQDIPASKLRDFVPVEKEGSVDEDLLEDSKRRIERYLHGQGYWRAAVDYERTPQDGRLDVTFRVRRGALYQVERVDIDGVAAERLGAVQSLITLKSGSPFVEETLGANASAIEDFYRVRGFATANVQTEVAEAGASSEGGNVRRVVPRIVVQEGEATTIGRITMIGASAAAQAALQAILGAKPGAPFYAPQLIADRNAATTYYDNLGYRDARVDVIPRPSGTPGTIDVEFDITEGPQFRIGHVLISGNTRTSTETITREASLTPGEPVGTDELAEAQRRLSALGLFRRVRIDELARPGTRTEDVAIVVEEAPATTIGYGGGVDGGRWLVRDPNQNNAAVETISIAPRGFFEIGRRNLWGKNRSVNLFTRFSLRNRGAIQEGSSEGTNFYEYRVVGAYREPRLFDTAADAQITGIVEQGVRSSFNYGRQSVNAELARRLKNRATLVGRYTFGRTKLFDERYNAQEAPAIDRLFPQVRLSIFSGLLFQDTRDDPFDPVRGRVAGTQVDLATRALGSEVGFVKSFFQGFLYRRLPGTRKVVFAGGLRLGLATGFPREAPAVDANGNPIYGPDGQQEMVVVKDLPASERFYAGGDTTVRGYTLDRLGDYPTIDSDGFPTGGDALIIFNGELRFPLWRSLGGVVFVDAGNVFLRVTDLDITRIRPTSGVGFRYKSPIGPIRVDAGFKLDGRRTFGNGTRESLWEMHVSLGQAF